MMSKTFEYRLLKASWGIAIDIIGDIVFFESSPSSKNIIGAWKGITISLKFSDQLKSFLSEPESRFVRHAILLKKEVISTKVASVGETGILFNLDAIKFNLCDYQLEGIYVAVIKWLESELELEDIESINPLYNTELNKYEFPGIVFPYS
ncbi:hypothetical protein [Lewinella sp. LCG006]|uniref:hypothetical protein n=1 Tax=Lewinella sp. LCG006 TaxID=3231911 RepID=UPI00345FC607